MSASSAIFVSIGVCILAATLEGVCAGKNVKAYFATLRWPAYSAPLWVWYIIGGLYYLIFLFVIYRVLKLDGNSAFKLTVLGLILFMMVANGLWNYVFFRAQNLFLAFIGGTLVPILDLALFICLIQLDTVAALSLIPYLLYRVYAVWWGYGLWKHNRPIKSQIRN
jgi:tryptophan-rich sensory protein